jgi:hypothetical protein
MRNSCSQHTGWCRMRNVPTLLWPLFTDSILLCNLFSYSLRSEIFVLASDVRRSIFVCICLELACEQMEQCSA